MSEDGGHVQVDTEDARSVCKTVIRPVQAEAVVFPAKAGIPLHLKKYHLFHMPEIKLARR